MGETRVNLQHLLEDIRDTYPFPAEEAILTELVANALDSGASEIRFLVSSRDKALTTVDNGRGMSPAQLEHYHDIAATTKVRGKGIGFAGVGAKLALLVAKEVITETRAGRAYAATRWRLESSQRAPWELIEPAGLLENAKSGTAVTLGFGGASPLLEPNYVEMILQAHFHPLLDETFREIFQPLYSNGVRFFVNKRVVKPPELASARPSSCVRPYRPIRTRAASRSASVLSDEVRKSCRRRSGASVFPRTAKSSSAAGIGSDSRRRIRRASAALSKCHRSSIF
jgi:hypothetical protein